MTIGHRKESQSSTYSLHNGDCMLRSEFHRLYKQMPVGYRAELVGGVVFEPSPVSWEHGQHHAQLNYLLKTYAMRSPGVLVGDNATVFLGDEDEVQPDLTLRLSEDAGGKSRLNDSGYIEGAPELVAEIAYSSRAIDLHLKKSRYAAAGVVEYIVVCLDPRQLFWFHLASECELPVKTGVVRSVVFPGLWIHAGGLLMLDDQLIVATLRRGMRSQKHREFAARLVRLRRE